MSSTPSKVDIIQAILTNQSLTDQEKTLLIDEFINEIKREYPDLKYHATKSDLTDVQLELTKELSDTRKEIASSKSDTIKWVASMLFVQVIAITGVFFAALKLFTPAVIQ